jgi:hypothetical protein
MAACLMACVLFFLPWLIDGCSGGHHPVEGQEGVGVHSHGGNGGVVHVRGGGVSFLHAALLRFHVFFRWTNAATFFDL